MYSPVSANWDTAIRSQGVRVVQADLYYGRGATNPTIADLPVSGYTVNSDRRSAIRRSATIKIVSQELLDTLRGNSGTSGIEPYGSEIRLKAGVIYPDGSTELVPLGVFRIQDLAWDEPHPEITMSLKDRSSALDLDSFSFPHDASTETAFELIQGLLLSHLPDAELIVDDAVIDFNFPGGTTYMDTALAVIEKVATALGAEFYFDVDGVARLIPVPVLDTETFVGLPDWVVDAGATGVLISANTKISRSDTFSQISVMGAPNQNTRAAFARAYDYDTTSPTYVLGPFGFVNKDVQRSELTTDDQCRIAAEAILADSKGLATSLSLSSLFNPALQEGDIISVVRLDGSEELHLVDSLNFSERGSMQIETRSERRT